LGHPDIGYYISIEHFPQMLTPYEVNPAPFESLYSGSVRLACKD
jgi:hypothetical protein